MSPLYSSHPRIFPARIWLLLILAFVFTTGAHAASLTLHQLFSSHMVLQRDADDPIWGWASPGATVTVKVFNENTTLIQTKTATAGSDGRWQTTVGSFSLVPNNAAYSLTVSDGTTTITLTDVLIGDVLLCAGQSNMAFSLNTIGVTNLAQEIADSTNYPAIRNFTVPLVSSSAPQTNIPSGTWQVAGAATTGNFTATGYFTAREIYKQQHIPIGMLCSAWAGSEIKSWLNPAFVSTLADFTLPVFDQTSRPVDRDTISGPYNAMIYPLAPFRIKAVEWYQGEYNTPWPEQYTRLLPGLMNHWRSLFDQPDLPFIIIQLPNFGSVQTQPVQSGTWAELREAQLTIATNDASASLVTTIDIGNGDLHPVDKQDVGLRAARAAAKLLYGQSVVDQGPQIASTAVLGNSIICTFTNVGAGLMIGSKSLNPLSPAQEVVGGGLTNFALCGANGTYFSATATITASNLVTVTSANVPSPVSVRYAWGNNPPCNLYNKIVNTNGTLLDGIPASPFRSDPVNRLVVNLGTGTGYPTTGAQVSISASNLTAQIFSHWSGDTNRLSAISNATVTATISQKYISVLANFRITGAPSGLAAASQSSQVLLNWNPLAAVHYNLKRSITNGGPYLTIAPNLVDVTSYTDANVTVGVPYYYVISATNLLGEGPDSAPVSITPVAGPPHVWNNVWDANGGLAPNPSDGSGLWLAPTNWWNGASNVSGSWSSVPDSAIFGAGVPGNYIVNLGGGTVYASNVVFNTSGYVLTNGTLSLLNPNTQLTVISNATATINATLLASSVAVSNGSSLILKTGSGNIFSGIQTGMGTIVLDAPAASSFTTTANPIFNIGDAGVGGLRILGSSILTSGGALAFGNGSGTGYGQVNSASAQLNLNGANGQLTLGRNGATRGQLDLVAGTMNFTASGQTLGMFVGRGNYGEFNMSGGTVNMANNLSFTINDAGNGGGTVNLSGGVMTLQKDLEFNRTSSGGTATFSMTGGQLFLGSGGMTNVTAARTYQVSLSGGTIGAIADWGCAMNLLLRTNGGNITFRAADASNNVHAIALSGVLSGSGGLTKTGPGSLTLSAPNTYTGGTIVSAGTLIISPIATLGTSNVTIASGATVTIQNPAGAISPNVRLDLDGLLNLVSQTTNTIRQLYFNGMLQPAGFWNATRDTTHFSGSGTINVIEGSSSDPVVLSADLGASNNLHLTWTNSANDLYFTSNLVPPVTWSLVTNPPAISNNQKTVIVPMPTQGTGFFRLQQ